jgi:hypothetical protein
MINELRSTGNLPCVILHIASGCIQKRRAYWEFGLLQSRVKEIRGAFSPGSGHLHNGHNHQEVDSKNPTNTGETILPRDCLLREDAWLPSKYRSQCLNDEKKELSIERKKVV